MALHIIACGVFRGALKQIQPERIYPDIAVTYISPTLHNYPKELKQKLLHQIYLAKNKGDSILCLYGRCYPDLDNHLDELGIPRVPGEHCYEILLGGKRFSNVIKEEAGTYFVERELALNFSEYCIQPLELEDPVMLESHFKRYHRLAYIRQPTDPDNILSKVNRIAKFLKLKPLVIDADYAELTTKLVQMFYG